MLQVGRHRFSCQQVDRNRVPRKRIQDENVEFLRLFELESQPRVARHQGLSGTTIPEERKVLVGNRNHVGIDFVQPVHIAGLPVRRERSDPEADDSHMLRPAGAMLFQGLADAARFRVIGCGDAALRGRGELRPMHDPSVQKLDEVFSGCPVRLLFDLEDTVEIARDGH